MNKIDDSSIGRLFTTNGDDAWRCISYCAEPTTTFLNLETGERLSGSIHSLNVSGFKPLTVKGKS